MTLIHVYFNHLCPFAYRGFRWLNTVREANPDLLTIEWKYFCLNENDRPKNIPEDIHFWEVPQRIPDWEQQKYAISIHLFRAIEAARRQGTDLFEKMQFALFTARYEDPLRRLKTAQAVRDVAISVGLDMKTFDADINDPHILHRLQKDHENAVKMGLFGTPFIVFPEQDHKKAYLRFERILTEKEALDYWQSFQITVLDRPYLLEFKRSD